MGELPRDTRGAGQLLSLAAGGCGRRLALAALAALLGLLALAGMLVACGGRPASPSTPSASQSGSSASTPAGNAGQPGPAAETPPDQEPGTGAASAATEGECQALLAHVVEVANRTHVQTVTPETAPTEAQLADIRARMAPEFIPMCLGLDRTTIACQMRASTRDQILACM